MDYKKIHGGRNDLQSVGEPILNNEVHDINTNGASRSDNSQMRPSDDEGSNQSHNHH